MGAALLDHRYSISSLLYANASARRFAGSHVGLDAPVRIVELRSPNQLRAARTWDASQCAAFVARAAALRHPALPRVRDCFYARGVCYVVEDALEEEWFVACLAHRRGALDLRTALRDGLLLCDAVALVAREAPELLSCLLIAGTTLAYDGGNALHLVTWDYSRWLEGDSTLEPGVPELRAPELRAGDPAYAPDERAHVYSIAALLAFLLTGSAELPVVDRGGDLPAVVRMALAPALRPDPRQRTPNAETLGRALARAARVALPALEPMAPSPAPRPIPSRPTLRDYDAPRRAHTSHASGVRPLPLLRPAVRAADVARHTAPRALRQVRERSRAAVMAALHRVSRPVQQ